MHPLTEDEIRGAFVNATEQDLRVMALPLGFMLTEWDYLDFFAWRDPHARGRGYLVTERDGKPTAIVLRSGEASASHGHAALCNMCHTMQPGDQVTLFSARRAGAAGEAGDAVGTYICTDLSCHENVRLAAPLTQLEIRPAGSVDARIDGARQRIDAFIDKVLSVRVP
ncbi:MAG: FBP domain-containing protein [Microbacteriaceae bacterium]|jgi:hypothetical protein|nr:FBP domain-containing protein [Microbacteriaceae bacterium]HOA86217.1 FBP domain-containing protein [Microbacteriaceae bacterium]HPZ34126.1 FBP domain-containing protein [Microbacteriaceae bacterium]HQC92408.1 FBP domain-containing protein [Microbacteriaceae bacterium]